ncbi:hypothetical protein MKX01_023308 [Papaver californicum]|nr:hypothetical protein MKX01_023308 [Papaver californicum]
MSILMSCICRKDISLNPPSTYAKCLHCNGRYSVDPVRNWTYSLIVHLKRCINLIRKLTKS